jgi:DNA-binding beta-propeller fold protein YncE
MTENLLNLVRRGLLAAAMLALLSAIWAAPAAADQKKPAAPVPDGPVKFNTSLLVWPQPPAIGRVKYMDYFSAQKKPPEKQQKVKSKSWMDRMAGVDPNQAAARRAGINPRFELGTPYGLAVDSKGLVYVADTKVGAVFIFDPENKDTGFIKHGVDAKFGRIFGLAIDDADRLFVSDGQYNHVLVFNKEHKLEGSFGEGILNDPAGMAIDEENRFLYVANTGSDQILVFDADTFKLLRKIGTAGKNHTLTDPGDFSKPTNVAVDKDGNLYVSDTLNDRVEEFDADGQFIRTFGKNGDGPGDFTRPKGIAIDCDGHVWVADAGLNRLQIFTPEGNVRLVLGGFGWLPGQFEALADITIDNKNRVFTSEQYLGRVQMFRYITNAEAQKEYDRRLAELAKKSAAKPSASPTPAAPANKTQPPPAPTPDPQKPPAAAPTAAATGKPS